MRRKLCRTCETFLSSLGGQCLHSSPRLWGVCSSFLPGVWVSQRKTEREKGSTVLSKSSSTIPADRPAPSQYIFINEGELHYVLSIPQQSKNLCLRLYTTQLGNSSSNALRFFFSWHRQYFVALFQHE